VHAPPSPTTTLGQADAASAATREGLLALTARLAALVRRSAAACRSEPPRNRPGKVAVESPSTGGAAASGAAGQGEVASSVSAPASVPAPTSSSSRTLGIIIDLHYLEIACKE